MDFLFTSEEDTFVQHPLSGYCFSIEVKRKYFTANKQDIGEFSMCKIIITNTCIFIRLSNIRGYLAQSCLNCQFTTVIKKKKKKELI